MILIHAVAARCFCFARLLRKLEAAAAARPVAVGIG